MKKFALLLLAAILLALIGCQQEESNIVSPTSDDLSLYKSGDNIPGQYIVMFEQSADRIETRGSYQANIDRVSKKANDLLGKVNIKDKKLLYTYGNAIDGFAVNLTEAEANRLSKQPGVKVYPDKVFTLALPKSDVTIQAQPIPYGITRVGGPVLYTGSNKAWIIDTGIDLDHPDLNVAVSLGKTFVLRTTTPEDDNGHGTHCAGIVGALNNDFGVVGVAAGASVVPVKVLDRRGSGSYTAIIAGIDYVAGTALQGDAANLSLGGTAYDPIDNAVYNLAAKGVYVAIAAGNSSKSATLYSPARVNGTNLFTISACDASDVWAYFSNFGNPPIDYCAPGVSIYSTYKAGTYKSLSGTSMAAPHVCGILLVRGGTVETNGYVSGDPDGNPDPIAHL